LPSAPPCAPHPSSLSHLALPSYPHPPHCSTPTGTPTPTPSSSPLPWFDVVAAIQSEPELSFFKDLLDYQPNLPQLWQMMDPTVFAPTNDAFAELRREFPAFLEWLLGYPSCFQFNRLEYFLKMHATANYVPKYSVINAPGRTVVTRSMAPHPDELLKLVAKYFAPVTRRMEAANGELDAAVLGAEGGVEDALSWSAPTAGERALIADFAVRGHASAGVAAAAAASRNLVVNPVAGFTDDDYRVIVDAVRYFNLLTSPREVASAFVANGFLYVSIRSSLVLA
jgi:hypothetical protein